MTPQEMLWLSFKDLKEKKVRTLLTVLMVMIGVASIVALTSQTAGIKASISSSLSALGPTSIIVTSTGTGFTSADAALVSGLPNVSVVIPVLRSTGTLYSNGQNVSVSIVGISQDGLNSLLGGTNIYSGTMYNDTVAPDAVVGYSVAFPSTLSGRQIVDVGYPATLKLASGRTSQTLTVPVVGVLQPYGSSILSVDSSVVMSVQAADILLHRTSFNLMLIKATNTSSVAGLSDLITTIYGSKASVITTQQILQTTNQILGSISLLFAIIAGVSLLVAAVGIMNIMLIAVFERTHEIGIMKSVGFRSRQVMTIFLVQAMLIGVLGGLVGIGVGIGASYGVAAALGSLGKSSNSTTTSAPSGGGPTFVASSGGAGGARTGAGGGAGAARSTATSSSAAASSGFGGSLSYQPVFTPLTVASAILVAVIVSMIAGLYPAWRASKMEPIDALREL